MKKTWMIACVLLLLAAAVSPASAECKDKHSFGSYKTKRSATCRQTGLEFRYCRNCDHWEKREIPKLPHEAESWTVTREATCTAAGSDGQACTRCGRTRTVKTDLLEHAWGEWTVTKEPSGANRGTRERACALCGRKQTERFFPEGTLYRDMTPCEEVIRLQEMLRDLGEYQGSIRTGQFGEQTYKAVARFQRKHGLKETGVVDAETLESIRAAWKALGGSNAL